MNKTKLTLYVDKEVSEKAKRLSKISGKSISSIISDFIYRQDMESNDFKISEKVEKWIGIADAKEKKEYKELRDIIFKEKIKKI